MSIKKSTLGVIIPTWNESQNLPTLYKKIQDCLEGVDWSITVVDDDSADKTWQIAQQIGQHDPRVKTIRRIDRKGLASACIEGISNTNAEYFAVIDADLQHDETLLPKMLAEFQNDESLELVTASRKIANASFGSMPKSRIFVSELARKLTNLMIKTPLSDPMSGFFMIKKSAFERAQANLFGRGFKVLLDLCSAAKPAFKFKELPYTMRSRHAGESKFNLSIMFEFISFLLFQSIGRKIHIPTQFIKFCMVGLSGVAVHMSILTLTHRLFALSFVTSQVIATLTAMTCNFMVNNRFTFKGRTLAGLDFYRGIVTFFIVCSIGALIGIAISVFLNDHGVIWWLAALISILITSFWNYTINLLFTWKCIRP